MSEQQSDQWLDELLAQPPILRDKGFSESTWQIIQRNKQRRALVFKITWFFAFLLVVLASPWADIQVFIQQLAQSGQELGLGSGSTNNYSVSGQDSAQLSSTLFTQWFALLQNHWALLFAGFAMIVVSIKNVLLSDV